MCQLLRKFTTAQRNIDKDIACFKSLINVAKPIALTIAATTVIPKPSYIKPSSTTIVESQVQTFKSDSKEMNECPFNDDKIMLTYTWKNDFERSVKSTCPLLKEPSFVKSKHIMHHIPSDYEGTVFRIFITEVERTSMGRQPTKEQIVHKIHYFRMDKKSNHKYLYIDNKTPRDWSPTQHIPMLKHLHGIDVITFYGCTIKKSVLSQRIKQ